MSFSKPYILERLIEGYIKAPTSLEEQTFDNVALRICHNCKLKQHIFSLKVELPEFLSGQQLTRKWEKSILKESTEICKTFSLPVIMEQHLISHIRKIAVQLLIWSGIWKIRFDISCNLTADLWIPEDWKDGRLNERKIAERIIRDTRISNYQRYQLSCFYCLEESVPVLWNTLSLIERFRLVSGELGFEKSNVIRMWSFYMANLQKFRNKETLYVNLFYRGLEDQCVEAVIFSWDNVSSITKQNLLVDPLSLPFPIFELANDEGVHDDRNDYDNFTEIFIEYFSFVAAHHRRNSLKSYPFMDSCSILLPFGRDLLDTACFILSRLRDLRITGFEPQSDICEYITDTFVMGTYNDFQFAEYPASNLQISLKQIFKWHFFSLLITNLREKAVNIFLLRKFQNFVIRAMFILKDIKEFISIFK